ncbi:MAG TPA: GtrA family protein [Candidatus Nitrosopolaris sp.]|nr:GtrA family protein [Candidatus Nitrosopolaris sp.]
MPLPTKQLRFGLVGVFNTLFNLLLFNIFIFFLGISVAYANVLSLLISILISYFLNAKFVFAPHPSRNSYTTFGLFMSVSLFSQLVVQQLVVVVLSQHVTGPGRLMAAALRHLPLLVHLSERFYVVNTAKCLAIALSLLVNFLLYDRWVFATKLKEESD